MSSDSMVVSNLPSRFRCYPNATITTRGLYYHEAKNVAKYLDNEDLEQLAHTYKDVIGGIDVLDLEVVDFNTLIILSSMWTLGKFEWNPTIQCMHSSDGVRCTGSRLESPITIDDFDFTNDESINVDKVELSMPGWYYYPRRVRDELDRGKNLDDDILSYATTINNESRDATLEDRYNVIKYAYVPQIEEISKIHNEMLIRNKPIKSKCNTCHNEVRLRLTLDDVRRCP